MTPWARAGWLAGALLATVGAGCARPPRGGGATGAAPDTAARGVVRVVGSSPLAAVVLASAGGWVELSGPRAAELAQLAGAVVAVRGPAVAPPIQLGGEGRAIAVRAYVIDSIAGARPVVGLLRRDGSGLSVDGVPLAHAPPGLRRLAGSRVWVVGPRGPNGTLTVQAFGALTPAASGEAAPPRDRP